MGTRKPVSERGNITPATLKYITDRPGQIVYVNDLVKDLGYTREQIQGAITNWNKRNPLAAVTVMSRGSAWSYLPNRKAEDVPAAPVPAPVSKPTHDLLEILAVSKTGTLIAQDETGKLYRAVELEF